MISMLLLALFIAVANSTSYDGTLSWPNGDEYEGQILKGPRNMGDINHGFGKMKWPSGAEYEGQWSYGVMQGNGTYRWPSGEYYTGSWKNGTKDGYGELHHSCGNVRSGYWSKDTPVFGGGMVTRPDGSIFEETEEMVRNPWNCKYCKRIADGKETGKWVIPTIIACVLLFVIITGIIIFIRFSKRRSQLTKQNHERHIQTKPKDGNEHV